MDVKSKDKGSLDPDNNSRFCFLKVANAFLLLANLSLIILGFKVLPYNSTEKAGADILSIIVAVLAILVTALIGWQILQTIESKRALEKFEKTTKDYDEDLKTKANEIKELLLAEVIKMQDKTKSDIKEKESYIRGFVASDIYHKLHHLHSAICRYIESLSPFNDILYKFLFHSIKGLWHKTGDNLDVAYCRETLISMIKLLDYFPENSLTADQKSVIYAELEKIKPKLNSLKKFKEFMDIINVKQEPF